MKRYIYAASAMSLLAIGAASSRRYFWKRSEEGNSFNVMSRSGRTAESKTALIAQKDGSKDKPDAEWKALLSPKQYQVLRGKGTDRPRQGEYDDFYKPGTYVCAGCATLLYTSVMKFDCGCGWPGFYDCCPLAVREEPDEDGSRVEILCNACNGHLGHVFRGEGFGNPKPDERHCVNSTSLRFVPE
jgi:peptide-methionine (R)-S-oxide reductase